MSKIDIFIYPFSYNKTAGVSFFIDNREIDGVTTLIWVTLLDGIISMFQINQLGSFTQVILMYYNINK
jgi:hypothetical protein